MDQAPAVQRLSRFPIKHDWLLFIWLVFLHVGAIGAFFTFSGKAFGVFLLLSWLTGSVGICLGYHRYFTHHSFGTTKPVAYLLAVIGSLAGQGGPIAWVSAHRYHHAHSDAENDPHSPVKGFLWAHMSWLFVREKSLADFDSYRKYAEDLARDKFLVFLDRNHMFPSVILALVLYVMGGWPWLFWGFFARLVFVYHSTWLVNSASHIWGYRTYETSDRSRNNWWVALLTFGEGWHNNHHAFQRSARHGMKWWEIDGTYWTIRLLSLLGLVRDIQLPSPAALLSKTAQSGLLSTRNS